jgi:hypothetical protein
MPKGTMLLFFSLWQIDILFGINPHESALTAIPSVSPYPTCRPVMTTPASLELLGLFAALGGVKVPSLIFEQRFRAVEKLATRRVRI